jgi:hypothetical protein
VLPYARAVKVARRVRTSGACLRSIHASLSRCVYSEYSGLVQRRRAHRSHLACFYFSCLCMEYSVSGCISYRLALRLGIIVTIGSWAYGHAPKGTIRGGSATPVLLFAFFGFPIIFCFGVGLTIGSCCFQNVIVVSNRPKSTQQDCR